MFASGNRNKKPAKFNGLNQIGKAALGASLGVSVAVLLAACSSSGQVQESEEFSFSDGQDAAAYEPAETTEAQSVDQETEVVVREPPRPEIIKIRDSAPERYTVQKGDTLWDLASQYLENPWQWPELWYFNPQIVNPHLIYPGDVLVMSYVGNRPQLRVVRGEDGAISYEEKVSDKVTSLKPRVRAMSIDEAIPTLSMASIGPFLSSSHVLTKEQLDNLPRIIGSLDNRLISATGTKVYARGVEDDQNQRFEIVRLGRTFTTPGSTDILGREALEIGKARLEAFEVDGELSTFSLGSVKREVLTGDLLLPINNSETTKYNFVPKAPEVEVTGEIIALHNAISNVATNEVFIINKGARDGVEHGNVLAIDQSGAIIREPVPGSTRSRLVQLPKVQAGLGMVFRVFDRVSYVLIVDSSRAIHVGDTVRNPELAKDY
ncbi:peptidoglycan-binding LysM [gamma proteobacterium HTCC5015]|nr:peptidoglycan-binding LysM [gamma proteobacterium HTCC5015]